MPNCMEGKAKWFWGKYVNLETPHEHYIKYSITIYIT